MFEGLMNWLRERYEQFQDWLIDLLLWIPRKLWAEFLDEMAELIEGQEVPDFIGQAVALLGSWTSDAGYWFTVIEFNWGISLVMSAIGIRWAWSKIPFIGN
jgi:hypothetical protein